MIICFQGVEALNFKVKEMCYCALMACMMAIFSQIKIDLPGYVPITLQTFMVCLIALIAPCKVAVSACVVYLLMGVVGLPVFAGFQGGMGSLLGYSGGYIFSFPIMVYVISKLKTRVPIGLACIIGSVICYFIGTLWFMFVTKMNLSASLMMCVVPFIPGDLIKIVLAYCLSKKIKVKL